MNVASCLESEIPLMFEHRKWHAARGEVWRGPADIPLTYETIKADPQFTVTVASEDQADVASSRMGRFDG